MLLFRLSMMLVDLLVTSNRHMLVHGINLHMVISLLYSFGLYLIEDHRSDPLTSHIYYFQSRTYHHISIYCYRMGCFASMYLYLLSQRLFLVHIMQELMGINDYSLVDNDLHMMLFMFPLLHLFQRFYLLLHILFRHFSLLWYLIYDIFMLLLVLLIILLLRYWSLVTSPLFGMHLVYLNLLAV